MVGRDIERLSNIGKQFPTQALVIQCDLAIDLQQYVSFDLKIILPKLGVQAMNYLDRGDLQKRGSQLGI